jgi:hypothetical protein
MIVWQLVVDVIVVCFLAGMVIQSVRLIVRD